MASRLPIPNPGGARRIAALVDRLRVTLPLVTLAVVVLHQLWETQVSDSWPPSARLVEGVVVYGIVGPLVMFWTLDWIGRAARSFAAADEQVHELNRELEERVAERTSQLERATAELRAKNEALLAANVELQEVDALKDDFVDLVSHELRAPLTNINASVELLMGSELPAEAIGKLSIIGDESERLTRLVRSILDVSRIQAGRLEVRAAPVAGADVCREAIERARGAHPDREWRLAPAARCDAVLADDERLGQVLDNLLDNAAKYSAAGGPVVVTVRALDQGPVRFTVSDSGPGVVAEELPRIFERFHRVERGSARVTYGHGLGLYIARRLVELHGGRIWAENAPEGGLEVSFEIPAAPDDA
jgi:signal transduction histidine kinase